MGKVSGGVLYFKVKGWWIVYLVCFIAGSGNASVDRHDQLSGASHPYESWSRPSPGGGWGSGTQGSYYHYHVPLVGQQQGWGWAAESGKGGHHDILLWVLVGLLALAALGSLLLPLLLIPLGLSLLALLMGGMMMMAGGGMMMMMMMMMMPQPQAARTELVGRALETVSKMVAGDTEGAVNHILSTLELESYCPEKAVCNIGHSLSSLQLPSGLGLESGSASGVVTHLKKGWEVVAPFLPKNARGGRMVKRMEKAFWAGLLTGNCARLEKRCKRLREKEQLWRNHQLHHHNNETSSSTTQDPSLSQSVDFHETDNVPQPHPVVEESHHHHPQLVKPTFSTPTILM